MLKVEIGGDLLTTDGSESSHMHNNHTVDMQAGYEFWLMKQAKARNPDIQLYGLPWAYPGWVGADPITGAFNDSATPFTHREQTCRYMLEWVKGAKRVHGLDIDYVGIWNEASADATYVKMLRKALDAAGFEGTRIAARDGGVDICDDLAADDDYAAAVDVIALHYPSDFSSYDKCHALNKPVWASEESSSYDDLVSSLQV
jgi:galactosylceramidase